MIRGTAQSGSISTQEAWRARSRAMSILVSPSTSLEIATCASGVVASNCRMPPRWSQAITIIAPSSPQIC